MTQPAIFNLSRNPETDEQPIPLTLGGLLRALKERGVIMSLSTLSEIISTGDIAEQLGAGGDGSRREFHPDVAAVFAEFYREFKAAHGKKPQAPAMLRNFLRTRLTVRSGAIVPVSDHAVSTHTVSGSTEFSEISKVENGAAYPADRTIDYIAVAAAQGRAQGLAMAEQVLTAKEAAALLHISTRLLRKTVPAYRRFGESANGDRWLLSDLLSKAQVS